MFYVLILVLIHGTERSSLQADVVGPYDTLQECTETAKGYTASAAEMASLASGGHVKPYCLDLAHATPLLASHGCAKQSESGPPLMVLDSQGHAIPGKVDRVHRETRYNCDASTM